MDVCDSRRGSTALKWRIQWNNTHFTFGHPRPKRKTTTQNVLPWCLPLIYHQVVSLEIQNKHDFFVFAHCRWTCDSRRHFFWSPNKSNLPLSARDQLFLPLYNGSHCVQTTNCNSVDRELCKEGSTFYHTSYSHKLIQIVLCFSTESILFKHVWVCEKCFSLSNLCKHHLLVLHMFYASMSDVLVFVSKKEEWCHPCLWILLIEVEIKTNGLIIEFSGTRATAVQIMSSVGYCEIVRDTM